MTRDHSHLRLVRNPEPLGSYIRPVMRDYRHMAGLIASGLPVGTGVIVDACHLDRSEELRRAARDAGLDVVLDPRSVELSTPGGIRRSGVSDLPWGGEGIDAPADFDGSRCREVGEALAAAALEMDVSAVLAPTHYHDDFPSSWLEVDFDLTIHLRDALNSNGGNQIHIYFPLISKLKSLQSDLGRLRVLEGLSALATNGVIDAVWLRMHSFGSTSAGSLTLRWYIDLARDLHGTGVPIVAERTGTVGLALLAFGATAGTESGVTHGERYDVRSLTKPPEKAGSGFTIQPRVYLPQIGAFLKRKDAVEFFSSRNVKNFFACQGQCCKRGISDMLSDPRRHFLVTRSREVENLARVPQEARVEHYFNSWLRAASDRAARAGRVSTALARQREVLDQWRITLSEVRDRDSDSRPSVSPSIGGLKPPAAQQRSSGQGLLF